MSEVKTDLIKNRAGDGPAGLYQQVAAKMWCKYTSVTTSAVLASFNVSSLTDIGTGNTESNMINVMSDANYSGQYFCNEDNSSGSTTSASAFKGLSKNSSNTAVDTNVNCHTVHGDLV